MLFLVGYGDVIEDRGLFYDEKEWSFGMDNFIEDYDYDLILNKISLSVIAGCVIQINGFMGLHKSMNFSVNVPIYHGGKLCVCDDLEYGFSYSIFDNDVPVFVNFETGWVCIGNPKFSGKNVEFVKNCVAVIGFGGHLEALWLRPRSLPELF